MEITIPTYVWAAINLLVLYIIMKKFLFKPVTEFMEKRANSIKDKIDNAQKSTDEAFDLKRKYEAELNKAEEMSDKIIKEARAKAEVEYEKIVNSARLDAEDIRLKMRDELELERDEMLKEIKNQVASLALQAASKVMELNMDTEANNKLVNDFIDEQGVA